MFTQMKVTVLSDFEGVQVIDVKVSDMGGRPTMRLSLVGDFTGCGSSPDEVFAIGRVLEALRETVNSIKKYKGSSVLPPCLRDLPSQGPFPAMILVES